MSTIPDSDRHDAITATAELTAIYFITIPLIASRIGIWFEVSFLWLILSAVDFFTGTISYWKPTTAYNKLFGPLALMLFFLLTVYAMHVDNRERRREFLRVGNSALWLGRYRVVDARILPVHCSSSCQVFFATDERENTQVALKFMKNNEQFQQEIDLRAQELGSCVIEVFGFHLLGPSSQWREQMIEHRLNRSAKSAAEQHELANEFPFVLVMKQANQ